MPTRLTGMDAIWLNIETRAAHMHVGGAIVLDPSTTRKGGLTREGLTGYLAERLHLAAPLRRRLSTVPCNLDFPAWIEDPDFDLDRHVRAAVLPAPGGLTELGEFAAEVMSRPLDRTRPLWELWFVEGLEGGRVGLVTKTHHAAVDGVSGAQLTAAIMQTAPDQRPLPPSAPWSPEREPSELDKLVGAGLRLTTTPLRLARTGAQTLQSVAGLLRAGADRRIPPPPAPFSAPVTRLNGAIGPRRRVAFCELSLETIDGVRRSAGGTVNDVALATIAGGLRSWFSACGEPVDEPLVAMVPISTRPPGARGEVGNRVSAMLVALPVDDDDPVVRLRAVSASAAGAKAQHGAMGATTIQDLAELTPGPVAALAARLYTRYRGADHHRPIWNLVVSNIPGPRVPLYCAGARMEAMYPLGPVHEMCGLNITLFSYRHQVYVGLNADRDLLPDVAGLRDALTSALSELGRAVGQGGRARPVGARPV